MLRKKIKNPIYSEILQTFINFKVVCQNVAAWNWALQRAQQQLTIHYQGFSRDWCTSKYMYIYKNTYV